MVCLRSMHTWTIPLITIAFQMFLQMFGEDCLCDKNGYLDAYKHKNLTQEKEKDSSLRVKFVPLKQFRNWFQCAMWTLISFYTYYRIS